VGDFSVGEVRRYQPEVPEGRLNRGTDHLTPQALLSDPIRPII
jgi:hypothetical protein